MLRHTFIVSFSFVKLNVSGPILPFILGVSLVLMAPRVSSAQDSSSRTCTLQSETRNNTSASDSFRSMSNSNAPPSHVSKLPLRSLLYPGATAKFYARVVPFFLKSQKHVDVGYNSGDPRQANRQVEDMISRGIDGAIVDWYGLEHPDLGRASDNFRDAAESHSGFTFAISEDKGALKDCARKPACDLTRHLIDDLNYAYDHFEKSVAYLQSDGRPVVFFFDVNQLRIDWSRVRQAVDGNPLFVFRNAKAFSLPFSDGAFAWADHTGHREMPYLDDFYKKYLEVGRPRSALMFASVYKGFDDRAASWSENRVTNQECGQIWLDTFAKINRYFASTQSLDYVQVVTWNDYEEGTEIETGIDNCVQIQASISPRVLEWQLTGNQASIDHFTIYASPDGKKLIELAQLPADARNWELDPKELRPRRYQVFVQAVGKPSITDKMSPPVSWVLQAAPDTK
jgi:hypothetical protein